MQCNPASPEIQGLMTGLLPFSGKSGQSGHDNIAAIRLRWHHASVHLENAC